MATTSQARSRVTARDELIHDPRQIRTLASSLRQEIVDALEVAGPCTVRTLADHIGRKPDALYYHVHLLRRSGLVVVADSPVTARADGGARAEIEIDVAFRPLSLRYEPDNARNRAAVGAVVGTMLRTAERRFVRAFLPSVAVVSGGARNLWAGRTQGWLSDDDLRTLNHHIAAILRLLRSRRMAPVVALAGPKQVAEPALHEFTFVLAPRVARRTRSRKARA